MKTNTVEDLLEQGRDARAASRILARLSSNIKNQALLNIAEALETQQDEVLHPAGSLTLQQCSEGLGS